MRLDVRRLKWISIVAPVAVLSALLFTGLFVLDSFFQSAVGFVLAAALITAAVVVFSTFVFRIIDDLQRENLRQTVDLQMSASVANALSEASDDALLQRVLDTVLDAFDLEVGIICLLSEDNTELASAAYRGLTPDLVEMVRRQKVADEPIGATAIATHHTVHISDTRTDPRAERYAEDTGFLAVVSTPLLAEGEPQGILGLVSKTPNRFSSADISIIEQLARQIGLAVKKASLVGEVLRRNEELRLLNSFTSNLSSTLDLQTVLRFVLDELLAVSGASHAEAWLIDDGQASLAAEACASGKHGACARRLTCDQAAVLRERVARTGARHVTVEGERASACLPLQSEGNVYGVVYLHGIPIETIPHDRLDMLDSIARQGSVAISNARAHVRVQEMAVLEERERIAREMHDGLAQVLGYVNTKTFAVRRLLQMGDGAAAQALLGELEEAARDVYGDVREAVLALRSTDSRTRSLDEAVREYATKFERMSGVKTTCAIEGPISELHVPEMVELQVIRIAQEALSNVRKHAHARSATVRIAVSERHLTLSVSDDGRGFDVATTRRTDYPRFGLHTMRERAEGIGGQLDIHSEPGRGTQVTVRVPIASEVPA